MVANLYYLVKSIQDYLHRFLVCNTDFVKLNYEIFCQF